ncbi:hypothetical protein DL769_004601 [Monosporascus sp. CRB-8-3]|nr:hypothetical protein DL769_004601 [Monosporascus sp. CRB-8-3]
MSVELFKPWAGMTARERAVWSAGWKQAADDDNLVPACTVNEEKWQKNAEGIQDAIARTPDFQGKGTKPYRLRNLLNEPKKQRLVLNSVKLDEPTFMISPRTGKGRLKKWTYGLRFHLGPPYYEALIKKYPHWRFGAIIRDICERLSWPPARIVHSTRDSLINAAALELGFLPNEFGYLLPWPQWREERNRYQISIPYVDPSDHSTQKANVTVHIEEIMVDAEVPWTPEPVSGSLDDPIPEDIPEEDRPRHRKAVELLRWCAYEFEGSVGERDDVVTKIGVTIASFLAHRRAPKTPRNIGERGRSLFYPGRGRCGTSFRANHEARAEFPWLMKTKVLLYSPSHLRTTATHERFYRLYTEGAHYLEAYLAALAEADRENTRLARRQAPPLRPECYGDPEWHIHACPGCNRPKLCWTIEPVAGLEVRLCMGCRRRPVEEVVKEWIPLTGQPRLYRLLKSEIRDDFRGRRTLEGTREVRQRRFEEIREELEPYKVRMEDGRIFWRDAYGGPDDLVPDFDQGDHKTTSGRFLHPLAVSIDAIDPVAPVADSDLGDYHVPGNSVPTTLGKNLAKDRWAPVVLKGYAIYRKARADAERANAFRCIENCYVNRRLLGRRRSSKVRSLTPAQMAEIRKPWRAGHLIRQPTDEEQAKLFAIIPNQSRLAAHDASWRPPEFEWLWGQYRQIPDIYDFAGDQNLHLWTRADVNGDPVPWPFDPTEQCTRRVPVWSWWHLWCWMEHRYGITETCCNRNWSMDCDIHVYQLSLMRGHFEGLSKDRKIWREQKVSLSVAARNAHGADPKMQLEDPTLAERTFVPLDPTGLPPRPWLADPLSASVAKKHHGKQMCSGYTCRRPTDQRRDFDEDRRNMAIDTVACNFTFLDMAEEYWPSIGQDWDRCLTSEDDVLWPAGMPTWNDEDTLPVSPRRPSVEEDLAKEDWIDEDSVEDDVGEGLVEGGNVVEDIIEMMFNAEQEVVREIRTLAATNSDVWSHVLSATDLQDEDLDAEELGDEAPDNEAFDNEAPDNEATYKNLGKKGKRVAEPEDDEENKRNRLK